MPALLCTDYTGEARLAHATRTLETTTVGTF